ncbi:MAG: hypothetical protein JWN72_1292 [Thermoleophilia bacterium]|nr:hypothetical protein [Thermoleophilia bacterium]
MTVQGIITEMDLGELSRVVRIEGSTAPSLEYATVAIPPRSHRRFPNWMAYARAVLERGLVS